MQSLCTDAEHELQPAGLRIATLTRDASAMRACWDAFVMRSPEATFFHRAGWLEVIDEVFGHDTHYLYAARDGQIEGVLPLAHVRSRLFGNALVSLPFAVYGGVVADTAGARAMLEDAAKALATRLRVDHLEVRNLASYHPEWPRQDLYCTFRKRIVEDDETNMLAIPRKQRAMVRKGMKHGLSSTVDGDCGRFFSLYAENVHRHGTPALSRRYFEKLISVFGPDCEVLTVCGPDGTPLSSVLSFYFRDEVLPYYAGDHLRARELAANDFKYWELMRRAAGRGARLFDFGRSKRGTGSYDFKRNWGFEPQPLHYEYQLYRGDAIPQNNPLNPKYRAFIAVWRKLPLALANALGPHIVKSLG